MIAKIIENKRTFEEQSNDYYNNNNNNTIDINRQTNQTPKKQCACASRA